MRVIAGKAKGHRLKSPATGTRPITDRIKEAVFSSLGDVSGFKVLDLYAGSGSLGLEALSRGAKKAVFVESARDAIAKLEQNIRSTRLKGCEVVWSDVRHLLSRGADGRVDLIFLDPPYSMPKEGVVADLEAIVTGGFLADDGRVVVHRPAKESKLRPLGLKLVWDKDYGQSKILVFAHEEDEDD